MDETEITVETTYGLNMREQFAVMIVGSVAAFLAGKAAEKATTKVITNLRLKSADIQQ